MSKKFYKKYYDDFLDLTKAPIEDALTEEEVKYYISENLEPFKGVERGEIVFVSRYIYEDGTIGERHLFVILDRNTYIPAEFFGMILTSNLKKEKYKYNIKILKDDKNKLNKDSIVKTDHIYKINKNDILFKLGFIPENLLKEFEDKYKEYMENNMNKEYLNEKC